MTELALTAAPPTPGRVVRERVAQGAQFVGLVAAFLGVIVFGYCSRHDLIAALWRCRGASAYCSRVFDSLNPGFRQLGSVWLPLPHLLMVPFVARMAWWQSGLAGAIPSIGCYILGCIGIYRLARLWLGAGPSAVAVLFYGLNPGLLYMQTTAMTEPLFLAEMIWAALLLAEFCRALKNETDQGDGERAARLLLGAGLVLLARRIHPL